MRRAGYKIDGVGVEGHWNMQKFQVGDLYQMSNSRKWMVVEKVFDGIFVTHDGDGYFYQLRPATEREVEMHLAPRVPKESMESIEARIDYIGS